MEVSTYISFPYAPQLPHEGPPVKLNITNEYISSPLFARTPNMPGKVVVRMGLFDDIPPVVTEIYMRNKKSWEPAVEGAASIEGAPY